MRRMLCVAAAALALLLPTTSAEARTPVHARTKCVGLYCRIVTEPAPRPAPLPAAWRKGFAPRRGPKPEPACEPKPKRRRRPAGGADALRRAAAIARRYPGVCRPARVAACAPGCLCRAEARAELRR